MKVRRADGTIADITTGKARRLIEAGEATAVTEQTGGKAVEHGDDDKPKRRSAAGPKKDGGADVYGEANKREDVGVYPQRGKETDEAVYNPLTAGADAAGDSRSKPQGHFEGLSSFPGASS